MNKVVIVGCGGFGRETHQLFKDYNDAKMYDFEKYDILGFITEDKYAHGSTINGLVVLGDLSWFASPFVKRQNVKCVVAIANTTDRNKVVNKLKKLDVGFCTIIHPSVIMGDDVKIGVGCIICAGCILTTNIKITNHGFCVM